MIEKDYWINGATLASAAEAMKAHRDGKDVVVWYQDGSTLTIHGAAVKTAQEKTNRENRATCRCIAENLEAYTEGRVYRCPDCGETFELPKTVGDKFKCPCCGTVADVDDLEQLSAWDYMEDVLDIEYRINSSDRNTVASVQVMVSCGGPNIYIDTASRAVELYWWGDRATYPISHDAADALDEWAQEMWDCQ